MASTTKRICKMFNCANSVASLSHHKTSMKGAVHDFVIAFNNEQKNLESVIRDTVDLFHQLVTSFNGKSLYGRLIARINFKHFSFITHTQSVRSYHFTSYKTEPIEDVESFFRRHIEKIISRLDTFTLNVSRRIS